MDPRRKKLIALLVVVDVALGVCTFVDLHRRDASQIRGSKRFWRTVTIANPGNSLAYWLFGRKRISGSGPAT